MLSLAIASCTSTASRVEEAITDAGCVASPTAGAACEPGIPACTLDGPCSPIWTCDTGSHTWEEAVPNCFVGTPVCETPTPGGACDPGVPICPEVPEAGCIVMWTCDSATKRWDELIADAGCDADAGRPADGAALQDGASRDGESGE